MKVSKYNVYINSIDCLKIINTKEGSVVKITDTQLKDKIQQIQSGCDVIEDENIMALNRLGMIVDDDKEELCNDSLSQTLLVTLFVTKQCNFRCVYCYEKFTDECLNKEQYKTILSFISSKLSDFKYKKIRVNLFGGEPMLEYDNIIYFLEELNSLLKTRQDVSLSVGMTTNGYLLDIERYKTMVNLGLDDVQITVDGFSENHNKKRVLMNNKSGTWNKIMENLELIANYENHSKIILRTYFDGDTLEKEKDFLLYCKKRFNDQFIMHFEAIKKFNKNYTGACMSSKKETESVVDIIKFCKENEIDNIYKYILSRGFYACHQCSQNSYVFDTKLNVLKCTVLLDYNKTYVGKLNLKGVFESNDNLLLWDKKVKQCQNCNLYPLCLGRRCKGNMIKKQIDCCYNDLIDDFTAIINALY